MKRISTCIIVLLFFITCKDKSNTNSNKHRKTTKSQNIIQFYNSIPNHYLNFDVKMKKYKIYKYDTNWIATSSDKYSTPEVIVDFRNGYLFLHDQGTGGGGYIVEIAKFIDEFKNEFFALNVSSWNPVSRIFKKLKIFQYFDGKFNDVSKKVLPVINNLLFIKKTFTMKDQKKLKTFKYIRSIFSCKLPRLGTNIKFLFMKDFIKQFLSFKTGIPEKDKILINKLLNNIKKKEIILKWIYGKGIFEL